MQAVSRSANTQPKPNYKLPNPYRSRQSDLILTITNESIEIIIMLLNEAKPYPWLVPRSQAQNSNPGPRRHGLEVVR